MDWDAVGQSILRYGIWREIFLGIGLRWVRVGSLYDHMLWIKVKYKGRRSIILHNHDRVDG